MTRFWLSLAPRVRLPGGEPCFPGVPRARHRTSCRARLKPGAPQMLDPADDVSVTPWQRSGLKSFILTRFLYANRYPLRLENAITHHHRPAGRSGARP